MLQVVLAYMVTSRKKDQSGHDLKTNLDLMYKGLKFGLSLPLCPYLLYARSRGSDKTGHMQRLVRVFTDRQCDEYQNLVCVHKLLVLIGSVSMSCFRNV